MDAARKCEMAGRSTGRSGHKRGDTMGLSEKIYEIKIVIRYRTVKAKGGDEECFLLMTRDDGR